MNKYRTHNCNELRKKDVGKNVLLSGCSAGGEGTFVNTDWIYNKLLTYNANIRYKAAPVAGWFYAGNCTDEQSPGF